MQLARASTSPSVFHETHRRAVRVVKDKWASAERGGGGGLQAFHKAHDAKIKIWGVLFKNRIYLDVSVWSKCDRINQTLSCMDHILVISGYCTS